MLFYANEDLVDNIPQSTVKFILDKNINYDGCNTVDISNLKIEKDSIDKDTKSVLLVALFGAVKASQNIVFVSKDMDKAKEICKYLNKKYNIGYKRFTNFITRKMLIENDIDEEGQFKLLRDVKKFSENICK